MRFAEPYGPRDAMAYLPPGWRKLANEGYTNDVGEPEWDTLLRTWGYESRG
jgi:hypothetical protein